jgi:hypothetical protein
MRPLRLVGPACTRLKRAEGVEFGRFVQDELRPETRSSVDLTVVPGYAECFVALTTFFGRESQCGSCGYWSRGPSG